MKNSFSCEHKPLLNVPLCNIVLDELHLMFRVTGSVLFAVCDFAPSHGGVWCTILIMHIANAVHITLPKNIS